MIKATPAQLRTVTGILARYAPGAEVRAFGSRAGGRPKGYSDLDLAIVTRGKLGLAALNEIREAFSQSDLPFRVDVLDWNALSPEFKKTIGAKYEVLQRARRRSI